MKRLLLLLCAASLALVGCSSSSSNGTFQFTSGTALGKLYPVDKRQPVRDFTADGLDGGTFNLAATKGKVVVLNFWAAWCPPCKAETPQFDLVYRAMHAQGVDFVGIDTKDVRGNAQAFVKDNDISYPMVFDEQGEVALRLGNLPSVSLPFTVLIDKTGKVAAVYVLALSAKDLNTSLDKLLAGH